MEELAHLRRPSTLARILERTAELGFTMASEDRTGSWLRTLAASKPAGRFLELGTGTGIATAWLLDGMDRASELTSVDIDPQVQAIARESLSSDPRLTLVTEDGLAFLKRQPPHSFDFVFADAMAGKYEEWDAALRTVKPGGFYVIDDMLPQANWPAGHALKARALAAELAARADFAATPMAWASGLILAVRKFSASPLSP
jgi:predicted O-methyltransferase YrrM